MTTKEMLLLILEKCPGQVIRATRLLSRLESISDIRQPLGILARDVLADERNVFTPQERAALDAVALKPREEKRTEVLRFRCTPNERAVTEMLADRYAGGDMSKLFRMALDTVYSYGIPDNVREGRGQGDQWRERRMEVPGAGEARGA